MAESEDCIIMVPCKVAEGKIIPTTPTPKYSVGERVKVHGWGGNDFGKIKNIKWTYHLRLFEWVWGYEIDYEGAGAGLALIFVPEGYLEKVG